MNKIVNKMKFKLGSELDKQIYKEGEPTWGCKSGVLDVEDVKDFIEELDNSPLEKMEAWQIRELIKFKAGGSCIKA